MKQLLPSRVTSLFRREFLENKMVILLGPVALVMICLIAIIFSALFVDRVGTLLGGPLVGDFLQELQVTTENTGGSFEIELSNIEGGTVYLESFTDNNSINFQDPRADTKVEVNKGELIQDPSKLNEILYHLHRLLMLVPLFIAINYLLGTLLYDRLDGSYYFWRSMPVSPREEIIVKIIVALFAIPLTYVLASLLIQALSLLIFIFPIYRIGLDPISVIFQNLDISDWLWFLVIDWLDRGIMLAPVFSFIILISAISKRSAMFAMLSITVLLVFLESIFWGTNHIIDGTLHFLPWPISDHSRIIDSPSLLVTGLIVASILLSMAIYFRSHPFYLKD